MVREVRLCQLERLKTILGMPHEAGHRLPSSLYVWGPHNSGKTYIINRVIKITGVKHVAEVTAMDILCGKPQFLQSIISQLRGGSEQTSSKSKCTNLATFVQQLILFCRQECIRREDSIKQRIILVVNQVHLLKEHPDILHGFERLQEMIQHNICVIFTSNRHRTRLTKHSTAHMTIIHFPQYTEDEVVTIILRRLPGGPSCQDFVSTIVQMHREVCRDLIKLWRLVSLHFPEFSRRIITERDFNAKAHCRRLMSVFKRDLEVIHTEEIPGPPPMISTNEQLRTETQLTMSLLAKHVLISAFLASCYSDKPDPLLVVPVKGLRKRKRRTSETENSEEVIREPKTFSHERLMSIYRKLSGKSNSNADIIPIVRTLCNSKLMVRDSDSLEDCTYRCLADKRLLSRISETIDFPLKLYLRYPIPNLMFDL